MRGARCKVRERWGATIIVTGVVLLAACGTSGTRSAGAGDGQVASNLNKTLPGPIDMMRMEWTGDGPKPVVTQDTRTKQGPLTSAEVLAVLDHGGIYDTALRQTHGGVGAHASFDVVSGVGLPHVIPDRSHYDILAIKFPTGVAARRFEHQVYSVMRHVGHAQDVPIHVVPAPATTVLALPPSPLGYALGTTTVGDLVYPDGTYYLMSITAHIGGAPSTVVPVDLESFAGRQESERVFCQQHPKGCGPATRP
jgi:hypothetical protein